MKPLKLRIQLLVGTVVCHCKLSLPFEIVEKVDIFRQRPCPAFLMFENTAYLADMSFELPCSCKPEEVSTVVWYYQKRIGSNETTVLTDYNGTTFVDAGNIRPGTNVLLRFSIRLFSLIVFKAQVGDTGHYICGNREGAYFYAYDIDVQSSRDALILFADYNQHPAKNQQDKHFTAFTTFWDWTICDRCGVRGEQRRIGLCYLKSSYLFTRYGMATENIASCGSGSVPNRFKRTMTARKTEILIRSCTMSCSPKPKHLIKDFLVQKITSMVSKLGTNLTSFDVPIQFYVLQTGIGLIISCPGARPEHAVAWDKDNKRLYRVNYLVGMKRNMRVFIDHGNQLHIKSARAEDKGLYYCWLEGRLTAGFRLITLYKKAPRRSMTDPETIFAMQLIFISYVVLFILFVAIHCFKCCFHLCGCC
ncbi:Ig-like V-type domain-containing protein FAM187A [Ambystoma mexicanum]|uniref:Ig-like V-type domain-containing protein FAM187A n=1 Tax=Ambystoma mexicanum TaxID=8296 RepID=UPI0037E93B44